MSEFLERSLNTHGGLERWRNIHALDARVSLTGALYRLHGYSDGLRDINMRLDVRRPAVTITPYAQRDGCGFGTHQENGDTCR